jgi:hypothetical protein
MGGQGEHVLELFLDDPYSEQSIWIHQCTVSLRSPMMVQEHSVFIELRVGVVGTYWVKVFAGGVMIGQRTFVVAQYREAEA